MRNCCFNWKVWAGIGVGALAILLLVPSGSGTILPVAIGLACPLSMAAMMWSMRASGGTRSNKLARSSAEGRARVAALETEIAELRRREAEGLGASAQRVPIAPAVATPAHANDREFSNAR